MWLVNAALRRPYTVWVAMLLVAVLGIVSYFKTPTDILPNLKVPVVVVFVSYRGMPAPDMEQTVVSVLERSLTRCDYLEHIESRSMLGIGIIKVYFRPEVDPDRASSQVTALIWGEMQNLPPGMLPPTILKYDASSIPVGNLVISSNRRDDKYLLDLADYRLREELANIEGLAAAPVFGGVFRQVQIYVHPRTLQAMNLSPMDIARYVNSQSQVIPTGEIRIDQQNYYVSSNCMIQTPEDFKKIPIPLGKEGGIVYLGDIAEVIDGTRWRTNTVRVDGRRAVYMPLLRQAGASAVKVVDNVREFLPELHERDVVPEDVQVEVKFDQSQYARDALHGLQMEGLGGAVLASLVVLLFLGSLRTTWIVALSIPLSILAAFGGLYLSGHTLNIMTLGGLALVLGRLVDDSIVDVENTVRHLGMGKTPLEAARDSASEISVPVLMATITTVVVFLPLVFMEGIGKYLFTPLAVSAALAMGASYLVSRTVSPLYCARVLRPHGEKEQFPRRMFVAAAVVALLGLATWLLAPVVMPALLKRNLPYDGRILRGLFRAIAAAGVCGAAFVALTPVLLLLLWLAPRFDGWYESVAATYERALTFCLRRRAIILGMLLVAIVPAVWAAGRLGQELFPEVDSSEFTLHMRASGGPRVEETERQVAEIEQLLAGQHGSGRDLMNKMRIARRVGDVEFLRAVQRANPDLPADFVKRFLESNGNPVTLDKLISEQEQQQRERYPAAADEAKRRFTIPGIVPPEDLDLILSNLGISSRWSAIYTSNNGPHAAFVRVQLRSGFAGRRTPTRIYVQRLRPWLAERFPGHDFYFETGGMIRRILNAGSVAPIEVQVAARNVQERRKVVRLLDTHIGRLPTVRDTYMPQEMDLPQLRINVDRTRAARLGYTETDVVRNVIAALMSSAQIAPNFWIDPQSGNPYFIGVQYPEHLVENVQTLENIPISVDRGRLGAGPARLLKDVAELERTQGPVELFHYDVQRVSELLVSIRENDLAGAARDVQGTVKRLPILYAVNALPPDKAALAQDPIFLGKIQKYFQQKKPQQREKIGTLYGIDPDTLRLPKGMRVQVRGEITNMSHSFKEMAFTLLLAVLLVYLVMAAQFSSWLDPLIMIVAAPLGLIGVTVMLWLTGTSLNIQSAMGVLMMVGISVSNSVLVVEFANRQREAGLPTLPAILAAARTRLRPIVMTTLATIAGLLPMAIHLRPGDEMNLPLARAVIGGLAASTVLTLFVVPVLYTLCKPREAAAPPVTADN